MALKTRKIMPLVLVLVFSAGLTFGQSMIIAVERFSNTSKLTEYDWFGSAIADTITSDLQSVSGIKVIDQSEVVLKQLELGISDLVSSQHQLRIGEALAANTIVIGAFQILGKQIQITAKFINVESTEVIKGTKVFGKIDDKPTGNIKALEYLTAAKDKGYRADYEAAEAAIQDCNRALQIDRSTWTPGILRRICISSWPNSRRPAAFSTRLWRSRKTIEMLRTPLRSTCRVYGRRKSAITTRL